MIVAIGEKRLQVLPEPFVRKWLVLFSEIVLRK